MQSHHWGLHIGPCPFRDKLRCWRLLEDPCWLSEWSFPDYPQKDHRWNSDSWTNADVRLQCLYHLVCCCCCYKENPCIPTRCSDGILRNAEKCNWRWCRHDWTCSLAFCKLGRWSLKLAFRWRIWFLLTLIDSKYMISLTLGLISSIRWLKRMSFSYLYLYLSII